MRLADALADVRGSHALRLASKLLGSSVIAQVAVLVATAFAATRVGPADFALYGAVSGGAWFASSFNTLAADSRIPVVDPDTERSLLRAGFAATAGISALGLVAGAPGVLAGDSAGWALWLTAGCAFLLGVQLLYTAVILRSQRQEVLARGRLVQGVSNAVLIVAFVISPIPGFVVLSLAWLLSVLLGDVVLRAGARPHLPPLGLPSRADWTLLARQVKLQPVSNTLTGAVGNAPLMLLPALGHAELSGAWAITSRFLNPVVNTVYNTLQPLYYGRAAEQLREGRAGELRRFHRRWTLYLLVAAVPVTLAFVVVILWGLPLLGPQWRVAAQTLAAGLLFYVSTFAFLPLQHTLQMLGRLHLQFVWTAVRFVVCLAPFALLGVLGPWWALTLWAAASAATWVAQSVLQRRALAQLAEGERL